MSEVRTIDDVIRDFGAGKISHEVYKELIANYNEAVEEAKPKKQKKAELEAQEEARLTEPEIIPVVSILNSVV